jgi:hypothetical protein
MKTTKTVPVPGREMKVVERYCDICGCDMDDVDGWWECNEAAFYWFNRTTEEGKQLDICPECMKTRVIPFVEKKFGIAARKIEGDNICPIFH